MPDLLWILNRHQRRQFCFEFPRMRIVWRKADRHYDLHGRPAVLTMASSRVRRDWADVLFLVMELGGLVRVRHQHRDEPALMIPESQFRALERLAGSAAVERTSGREPECEPDRSPSPPFGRRSSTRPVP